MSRVNPDSPYLGMRGGYKGGGRPKVLEGELRSMSIKLPQAMRDYLRTKDVPAAVYIRSLIEKDMNDGINNFSPTASRLSGDV